MPREEQFASVATAAASTSLNTRVFGAVIPGLTKSQLVYFASFTFRSKSGSFVCKIWGWSGQHELWADR
ncbi:hypothetical protein Pdw03_5652 [Penicillium digitatum]|uniref:Uncharacterized protein n=1 Tax=Penicillium digitatum TaxID=36651 RepID=A0A7T6XVV0_PENDI|nr:hypothetical protein Pdw03_5652 [Penicillium digitatum]